MTTRPPIVQGPDAQGKLIPYFYLSLEWATRRDPRKCSRTGKPNSLTPIRLDDSGRLAPSLPSFCSREPDNVIMCTHHTPGRPIPTLSILRNYNSLF